MGVARYLQHYFTPTIHNTYRPRVLHRAWLVFFLVVVLAAEGFLVSNLVARQTSVQFLAAVVPAEIISLTNEERASQQIGELESNSVLQQAAQAKADDMAKNNYFSHDGPDGKKPWDWISAVGYSYQYAGENLAVRFVDSHDVVDAWMVSPSHRANIVKGAYTQIGVGVAQGFYEGEPATYVVQFFATPKQVAAAESKPVASTPVVPAVTKSSTNPSTSRGQATPASKEVTKAEPVEVAQPVATSVAGVTTDYTAAVTTNKEALTQTQSFAQSIERQLVRAFAEPKDTSNMVLAVSAAILLIALCATFFMHLQIQHPAMLATGAFVAFLALFFIALNIHVVGGTNTPQTAVVVSSGGVVITPAASDTGYAIFPHQ